MSPKQSCAGEKRQVQNKNDDFEGENTHWEERARELRNKLISNSMTLREVERGLGMLKIEAQQRENERDMVQNDHEQELERAKYELGQRQSGFDREVHELQQQVCEQYDRFCKEQDARREVDTRLSTQLAATKTRLAEVEHELTMTKNSFSVAQGEKELDELAYVISGSTLRAQHEAGLLRETQVILKLEEEVDAKTKREMQLVEERTALGEELKNVRQERTDLEFRMRESLAKIDGQREQVTFAEQQKEEGERSTPGRRRTR